MMLEFYNQVEAAGLAMYAIAGTLLTLYALVNLTLTRLGTPDTNPSGATTKPDNKVRHVTRVAPLNHIELSSTDARTGGRR